MKTKYITALLLALTINISNIAAQCYYLVDSDQQLIEEYAENIDVADIDNNLIIFNDAFEVYNTTNRTYQKCFKIYLTDEGNNVNIVNQNEHLNITDESGNVIYSSVGPQIIFSNRLDRLLTQSGYYYILIDSDTEGNSSTGIFSTATLNNAVAYAELGTDNLTITKVTNNYYAEPESFWGNAKCNFINDDGFYFYALVYEIEMKAGDVFSTTSINNSGMLFVERRNSEFSDIQLLSANEGVYTFTAETNATYYVIFGTSDLYFLPYNSFEINITNNPSTSLPQPAKAALPAQITGYYSITGIQLQAEPESGTYIIQYDNGTSEKIIK